MSGLQWLGGIPTILPNKTDDVDTGSKHWYVSYNSRDRGDYGSDTTALVLGQCEYLLVLNGDHRAGFQAAIDSEDGFKSRLCRCLEYAREHKDKLNKYSDPLF